MNFHKNRISKPSIISLRFLCELEIDEFLLLWWLQLLRSSFFFFSFSLFKEETKYMNQSMGTPFSMEGTKNSRDSIVAIKGGSCHFKGSSLSPFPLFSRISILGFPLHSRNSTTACWIVWNLLVLGLKAVFPFLKDVCVGAKRRNHRRVTGKNTHPWSRGLSNTKTELNSGSAIS